MYVAEAGKGSGGGNCVTLPWGEPACPGATGAISRLWRGVQQRVVAGLPSYAGLDGSSATGPADVSFEGSTGYATVYRIRRDGTPVVYASGFTTILDLTFDREGNLYVLEHSSGPVFFGGTGTLWRVARNGSRTAVVTGLTRPTSVAIGPDGAAYISNNGIFPAIGEVLRFANVAPHHGDDHDEAGD